MHTLPCTHEYPPLPFVTVSWYFSLAVGAYVPALFKDTVRTRWRRSVAELRFASEPLWCDK